jgi:hypothetical protein
MNDVLCINAGGIGDLHGLRMRRLTEALDADLTLYDVDKSMSRHEITRAIWSLLRERHWDLVYQESTGIAVGLPLIAARHAWGQRFVVSTGDPVSGYVRTVHGPLAGYAFGAYERLLYRACAGFIGWTPYLTGRALHLGAPRGVTIEGAAELDLFRPFTRERRATVRADLGLPANHLVCGVVGSLRWTPRQNYCYGLELVEMLKSLKRSDVSVLIVGDGSGLSRLKERVPPALQDRVVFTGRVSERAVVRALNAMDVGFITQTLDGLGSYRLTTKLPEYLATGLPVAMSPIPGYYDYARDCGWTLPPAHPASDAFHQGCATLIDRLTPEMIAQKAAFARSVAEARFDYGPLKKRFAAFVHDLLPAPSVSSSPRSTVPVHTSPSQSSTPIPAP